jgi:hypothetical protein
VNGTALADEDPLELIELASVQLEGLERPDRPLGALRQVLGLARRQHFELLERRQPAPDCAERTCAYCGAPLPQSRGGRPRRWCSERCRELARKLPHWDPRSVKATKEA